MVHVDANSFLVIVVVAATAGILVAVLDARIALPVVVVELMLGIVVGPDAAGIAHVDAFTDFEAGGIVISLLYSGSATATTAIGTLIPILRDRGELRTEFGPTSSAPGRWGSSSRSSSSR